MEWEFNELHEKLDKIIKKVDELNVKVDTLFPKAEVEETNKEQGV